MSGRSVPFPSASVPRSRARSGVHAACRVSEAVCSASALPQKAAEHPALAALEGDVAPEALTLVGHADIAPAEVQPVEHLVAIGMVENRRLAEDRNPGDAPCDLLICHGRRLRNAIGQGLSGCLMQKRGSRENKNEAQSRSMETVWTGLSGACLDAACAVAMVGTSDWMRFHCAPCPVSGCPSLPPNVPAAKSAGLAAIIKKRREKENRDLGGTCQTLLLTALSGPSFFPFRSRV